MNLDNIEKLIRLMQQYDLSELQVKEKELEFQASRGPKGGQPSYVVSAPMPQAVVTPAGTSGTQPAAPPPVPDKNVKEIIAPIVGTFYRAPSPEQAPFKEVGDRVSADDVVCIIEAMKVMNEIKAGVSGKIKKLMVENATPVEFGQPLFQVEVG